MTEIKSIEEQIKKTEKILEESKENLKKNPDDYSAKLLAMSVENHLVDLLKQLDKLKNN